MRLFRKPLILTNCKYTTQIKRSENGVDGILFNVNDEVVVKYDISRNYRIQNKVLHVLLEEEYHPKKYSNHQVGIDNVAESYLSTKIFEPDVPSDLVIDGWNHYGEIIPLDRVVKFLIARDIYALKIPKWRFAGATPSWDVCISLAVYLKLCEKIEGFEEKLRVATEIGDQIRGNLRKLDTEVSKGNYFSDYLTQLMRSLHSLNDELELAYNLCNHGWDIKFGGRGEPEYFTGSAAIEQKSRFPMLEHVLKENYPSNLLYSRALKDVVYEIKQYKRGLRKANIFFYNVSRLVKGLTFYAGTEIKKMGSEAATFNLADVFSDFNIMMKCILAIAKEEKVVIPYVKPYSINPKIICALPIPEKEFRTLENEKRRPYLPESLY